MVPSLPADATTSAVREQPADGAGHRRRAVVGAVRPERHDDDVDVVRRRPHRPLDGRDHGGVVTVAVAREDTAVVDHGVGAQLADDAADERSVAGLLVETAAAVVVGLVLVVPTPDLRQVAPRLVDDALVAQPGVLGVGVERAQPGVEHEHVRWSPAWDAQWCGEVLRRGRRPGGRRHGIGIGIDEAGRARRTRAPDAPEVPGHAVGEVHLVRPHLVAVRSRRDP